MLHQASKKIILTDQAIWPDLRDAFDQLWSRAGHSVELTVECVNPNDIGDKANDDVRIWRNSQSVAPEWVGGVISQVLCCSGPDE